MDRFLHSVLPGVATPKWSDVAQLSLQDCLLNKERDQILHQIFSKILGLNCGMSCSQHTLSALENNVVKVRDLIFKSE